MATGEVAEQVAEYLQLADRLLPGRVTGFYVVGSAALGEYVPGRSDVDFIALVGGDSWTDEDLGRLRRLHHRAGLRSGFKALSKKRSPTSGSPNGVFVREADVALPVTRIQPIASHVGYRFMVGKGFDVNPVVWKVLAERGITFRGAPPHQLGIDYEPGVLKQWNLENLADYWQPWGHRMSQGGNRLSSQRLRYSAAWVVAWGALGPPRLHCTMATGAVIGKLSAADYALGAFDKEWYPLIQKGLAYCSGRRTAAGPSDVRRTGEFVLAVVEAAKSL